MLGLRLLWREWKAGDLGILLLATFLAVAIVTGLGLFTERLAGAINSQSNKLLGADLVLEAGTPIDLGRIDFPEGTTSTLATEFMSMLSSGDDFMLCEVWAVDDHFPLKGSVQITDTLFGSGTGILSGPPAGEVWPDSRALQSLGVGIGDRVDIGDTSLMITRILVSAPGEGSNALSPLVLINSSDLAATGIVREGSRVDYNYFFAGPQEAVARLRDNLEVVSEPGQRVYSVKEGQPRLAQAINKAEQYLLLGSTLGVILAGAAIAIASRRYALEQESTVAVLKTLGLQARGIAGIYLMQLTIIAMIAILTGWLCGWLVEKLITSYIEQALNMQFEITTFKPLLRGALTGVFCLAIFAFPPLWMLRNVLPIRVLRREVGREALSVRQIALIGITGLFVLVGLFTRSLEITLSLFAGLLLITLVVGGVAWLLLRSSHIAGMQAGSQWRLATASLRRRALENSFQIVIFSTTLLLFLVLLNMRTTLIDGWQAQIPEGTPNYFLINISPNEVLEVRSWLRSYDLVDKGLYPIVRARLTHINDQGLRERSEERGSRSTRDSREINLTYSDTMPDDNKLVEGEWWTDSSQKLVSIEEGYAERLDVGLGDKLRFMSGGVVIVDAEVASIREVDWEQMRPNFFLITTKSVLEDLPAEFITSFYIPDEKKPLVNELLQTHPTTQLFEIDSMIKQVRSIIEQVTMAIESVLWLTVACGALVLIATIRASQVERMQESAILRTLGASGKLILNSLTIEFVLIGLIAGLLAAAGAEITSWLIQTRVFELKYTSSILIWWLGPLVGILLIGTLGALTTRRVTTQAPSSILRELAS